MAPSVGTEQNRVEAETVRRYHQILWGRGTWPEGAVLTAGWWGDGRGFVVEHLPVGSPEALVSWAVKSARADSSRSLAVGLAPRTAGLPNGKRGGVDEIVGLPCLWVDLDCAEGEHAPPSEGRLPTIEEAEALLADAPAAPSMVVRSGGGLHGYWLLSEPIGGRDPLLGAWKAYWRSVASSTGLAVDMSALDAPRALRLPGSVNPKGGRDIPVLLEVTDEPPVYSPNEMAGLLPEPVDCRERSEKRVDPDSDRPGDRMAIELPVSEILTGVLGWSPTKESDTSTRWHVPGGESDENESHAESVVDDDGVERVWAYSPRAQDELGQEDQTPVSSWELVAERFCQGDYKLAGALAKVWRAKPEGERDEWLLTGLETYCEPDDLAMMVSAGVDKEEPPDVSVAKAAQALDGTKIRFAPDKYVVFGGPHHGLWAEKEKKGADGETHTVTTRKTDWVAWRAKRIVSLIPTSSEERRPEYVVEVIARNGTRENLKLEEGDSLSITKIQTRSELPLAIPDERGDGALCMRNCLATLGASEREEQTFYLSTGWVERSDGAHMLVAPNGAIGASGSYREIEVEAASKTLANIGFFDPPPIREIPGLVGAVRSMIDLVPGRPEIGVALVGALAAAPLRMSRRCSVMIVGPPEGGKSVLARCATAWLFNGGMVPDALLNLKNPTAAGVASYTRWCGDLPLVADDFRRTSNRMANEKAMAALQTLVGAGYQDLSAPRATVDGRIRPADDPQTVPIITGEDLPWEEAAMVGRIVALPLSRGEMDLSRTGPVQDYLDRYVLSGEGPAANRLYGSYTSWVASQLDTRGPWAPRGVHPRALDALRDESDRRRIDWYQAQDHQTRASEVVASLAVGWQALREWAADHGVAHLLPSPAEVDAALSTLINSAESGHHEASAVEHILAWMRSKLETGSVFINGNDGGVPGSDVAYALGWRRPYRGDEEWELRGNPLELGALSKDGGRVLVSAGAWEEAAKRCPDTQGLSPRQVKQLVLEYAGQSDWLRRRAFSRMRGVVVPLSELISPDPGDSRLASVTPIRAEEDPGEPDEPSAEDAGPVETDVDGGEQQELFDPPAEETKPPAKRKAPARASKVKQIPPRPPKEDNPYYRRTGPSRFPGAPDLDKEIVL